MEIQQEDGEKKEELAEKEKEDKGEEKVQEEGNKEKPVKDKKAEKKSEEPKGSKRQKTIQCKVIMLDDSQFECELDVRHILVDSKFSDGSEQTDECLFSFFPRLFLMQKHAKGQELLTKVCDHINLLEKDYFGLANWETPNNKVGWCLSLSPLTGCFRI